MRIRGGWSQPFHYSEDQKLELMASLGKDEVQTRKLIDAIEYHVTWYKMEFTNLAEDPPAKAAAQRQEVADLLATLNALNDHLDRLDPLTWQYRLIANLRLQEVERPDEFLDRFQADTRKMIFAIATLQQQIPEPRRGRPGEDHKIGFIASIVADYLDVFGQMPAKHEAGSFHALIIRILGYLGDSTIDCSRLIAKAIERVDESRSP